VNGAGLPDVNEMDDRPSGEQRNDRFGGLDARQTEVRGNHDIAKGHVDVRLYGVWRPIPMTMRRELWVSAASTIS
jgi:hypothetical protein